MQLKGLVFLIALALLSACRATPTPSHPQVTIKLITADGLQPLVRDLADAYHQVKPYATVEFSTTNSSSSLVALNQGSADLAFVSRSPRADELGRPAARVVELGRDGLVVVVHPSNPVTDLSREQVAKLFAGEFLSWSEITGRASDQAWDSVQVISREEGSGNRVAFEQSLMAGRRVTLTALIQPGERQVLAYIAANRGAVGYATFDVWKATKGTRALAIGGVAPTLQTIQTSRYPLLQTSYMVVPKAPRFDVSEFVDFVASASGRAVIARHLATAQ